MTHMCQLKDELAAVGLDLSDFSTSSSEFLQKILRQQFSRASNYHHDAPLQVACRSVRIRNAKSSSFRVSSEEKLRRKQSEIRRHQRIFQNGHACSRILIKWLPIRMDAMKSEGKITEAEITAAATTNWLACPFCAILGEVVHVKVSRKRKVSKLVNPVTGLPASEIIDASDGSDLDYDPSTDELATSSGSSSEDNSSEDNSSEDDLSSDLFSEYEDDSDCSC